MKISYIKLLIICLLIAFGISGIGWDIIDTYEWSSVNLYTTPKRFNNLQGDKYNYRVLTRLYANTTANSTAIYSVFNDDHTSNYRRYSIGGWNTTVLPLRSDSTTQVRLCYCGDNAGEYDGFSDMYIWGESGSERISNNLLCSFYANASYTQDIWYSWKNTADELQSITICGEDSVNTSGKMFLMRENKNNRNGKDWKLIQENILSSASMNADPIIYNNLNSSKDLEYYFTLKGATTGGTIPYLYCYINNDRTGVNYFQNWLLNYSGGISASGGNYAPFLMAENTASTERFSYGKFYLPANKYKSIYNVTYSPNISSNTDKLYNFGTRYLDNSNNITSMVFDDSSATTFSGIGKLYKKNYNKNQYGRRLIYDYDFSGDFSSGHVFKNLKNNKLYEINVSGIGVGTPSRMVVQINSDTSNSLEQFCGGYSSTVQILQYAESGIYLADFNNANYMSHVTMLIFPENNGNYRPVLSRSVSGISNYLTGAWWKDASNNIYSFKILSSNSNNNVGNIKIYEIDLDKKGN